MAKNTKAFTKQIDQWIKQTEADLMDVHRESVKAVARTMQDNMPHESGNLKRSVVITKTPIHQPAAPDHQFTDPTASNEAVADSLQLGDHAYIFVESAYGARDNYGSTSSKGKIRPGKFWFEVTLSQWRGLVTRVAKAGKRGR